MSLSLSLPPCPFSVSCLCVPVSIWVYSLSVDVCFLCSSHCLFFFVITPLCTREPIIIRLQNIYPTVLTFFTFCLLKDVEHEKKLKLRAEESVQQLREGTILKKLLTQDNFLIICCTYVMALKI